MAELGTRQKVIIGIMGIAILYGVVDFLMPKKKDFTFDVKLKTEELNKFVTTVSESMGKDLPQSADPVIFSRAEKEWAGDPFLDERSFRTWAHDRQQVKEAVTAPKVEFIYSGYFEADGKRIAIINGIEYREGEALDVRGFVLKNVSPAMVVIENRTTRVVLNIPLQD
jgi:hypothetical protein